MSVIPLTSASIQNVVFFFVLVVSFQVAVARLQLDTEAKRRWQHALTGQGFVSLSYVLPIQVCIPALFVGAIGIYLLQVQRPDLFLRIVGPLLRHDEKEGKVLPGAFYFLLGTAVTAFLFPINTARFAVECLAIADPMAAWVGRSVPSPKLHNTASLSGSTACFVTASIIGFLFIRDTSVVNSTNVVCIHWSVFFGALACTAAEACPVGNDNILIPIATATVVHFVGCFP